MAWTDEMQAALVRLAAEGLTGKEIGERLGLTRSAVLGRAHRDGVRLTCKSKLNDEAIADIAARLVVGEKHSDIAAHYGVHRSYISHIKAGRRRPHLALQTPANEHEREGV